MRRHDSRTLLLGAHTSAAGGAHNALLEGKRIGATTVQLFTANQKRWQAKELNEASIATFKETLQETGLRDIMSHDSYLINLGAPDPDNLKKSRSAFRAELERCQALGITYLNFHPGAALHDSVEVCLNRIVESLLQLEELADKGSTRLLLETTAGQGSTVGWRFEELAYIIEKVQKHVPIGVCIDTCHIFAAGYDVRTEKGWETTLSEFDRVIGLRHLYAFHVNDSQKGLGSRVDRHQPLGEGEIGLECFRVMMRHPKLVDIPKYLETPGGLDLWEKEIRMLREFASHVNSE